jgi:peptide/nickel transport system permease protein
VVGINLSADLLTVLLTPRLRTAGRIRFISKKLRGASRGGWRSPGRALPHAPAHGQTAAVASKR